MRVIGVYLTDKLCKDYKGPHGVSISEGSAWKFK